jgi:hypothetical protein
MAIPHVTPLDVFFLIWCAIAFGVGAVLDRVKVPYTKLLLIRVASILGAALLLLGVWLLSGTAQGLYFGIGGLITVVALNFYCVRVCPHCARTAWPRYELALGLCPRCGTDLSCPHERVATWQRSA